MEGPDLQFAEAVIDNGSLGRHVVRFESGLLARQAAGSATVYLDDDTMLLSATTAQSKPRDALDFFPLTVDVEERMYAVGRIPGSFFRREGRPSEGAILTCRLIDRPLRPCFVKGLRNEVQVVVTIMALNPDKMYDVVAINAASLSTTLAGLPFTGPIGGVRVALIGDQWVGFPDVSQLEQATFDMVVAGRVLADGDVAIMMVEAESTEATWNLVQDGKTAPTEEIVAAGLEAAKPFIKSLCDAQAELAAKFPPKATADFPIFLDYPDDVYAAVTDAASAKLSEVMSIADKQDREESTEVLKAEIVSQLSGQFEGREKEITGAYRALTKKLVRQKILTDKVRIDGRGLSDIRTLSAEVGVIPRVHGSALFQRGETQILGVTTLNMLGLEQKLDTLAPEKTKRYMHNYNFPPYSTGETGRVGSPKRREIGHGALAERALVPVLPTREEFPYAIRQVSEALGSNGSTSMGSVCASTLALLNAGVPLRAPVAGIAMGLVSDTVDGETRYVALTDILGAEDAYGDMDFKVAGTRDYITALQLDTKLAGIPGVGAGRCADPGQGCPEHPARRDERSDRRAGRDEPVRAADHHDQDPGGQDRRGHRSQGQGDQPDPGRHRRRHLDRGRRHDLRRSGLRRQGRGRPFHDQRDRQPDDAGEGRALPRHRRQDHRIRRVRLAAARQGRPAAHLQTAPARRRIAGGERGGRGQRRPEDPGGDQRDRRPRQAVADPGGRGKRLRLSRR